LSGELEIGKPGPADPATLQGGNDGASRTGGKNEGDSYKSNSDARPDWLPEKFFKDGKPQVETLAKAYTELERTNTRKIEDVRAEALKSLMEKSERPKAATDYALPEKLPEFINKDELAKHPLTQWWRTFAWERGFKQDEFNAGLEKYLIAAAPQMPDRDAEIKKLGDNAQQRIAAVRAFVDKNVTDKAELDAIDQVAITAAGVAAIERLMRLAGDQKIDDGKGGGNAGNGEPVKTRADIEKMMQDPRYWNPARRDPAFIKEVQDWFEKNTPKRGRQ
jgi:hypothetical protein